MEDASLESMDVEATHSVHSDSSNASYGDHWTPPVYYQNFGFSLSSPVHSSYSDITVTDTQTRDHQDSDVQSELDFVEEDQERLLLRRVADALARARRHSSKNLHSLPLPSPSSRKQYPSQTLQRASEARKLRASPTGAASLPGSKFTIAEQEDTQMKEITTQMERASLSDDTIHYPDSSSSDTDDYEDSDDEDVPNLTQSVPTFSPLLKPATWSTREMTEGAIYGLTNSLEKLSVRAEGRAARRARPY